MNLYLDVRTIIIALGIGYLIALLLASAYWLDRTNLASIKNYLLAKCLQIMAWFSMALRGDSVPEFITISLANSILLVGTAIEIVTLLNLHKPIGLKTNKRLTILTICSIIGFQLIILLYNKEYIRIAYISWAIAALIIPASRLVLERETTVLRRVTGSLYMIAIMVFFVRGIIALQSVKAASFFVPGIFQLISILGIFLLTVIGSTAFVLLLKEKANQELVQLASYDDLTGTLNRRTFTIQARLALAQFAKKEKPVSYLLFDIDRFKSINDTYGHHVGDLVLQDLASQVKRLLGSEDLFVRYGGDEFGLLLPGTNEAESTELAERIKQSLSGGSLSESQLVPYTISIGVLTIVPNKHTQLETLYATCDKALYTAKSNGRDGVFRSQSDKLQEAIASF
ncbi:diguanylate cyclase [Paenibacillus sp. CF384]|uniref:GGDEF domain-containing protein n=1 Tax=Paenibacillus sp. CF384 TaxID=1884382 RepID=UPI00089C4513|nr:GGDEF domain-containing protein [Paenibacillus sp. CF384]SDX89837.1 diguanylate cyclase [Paenibacillus sp. CF384]